MRDIDYTKIDNLFQSKVYVSTLTKIEFTIKNNQSIDIKMYQNQQDGYGYGYGYGNGYGYGYGDGDG